MSKELKGIILVDKPCGLTSHDVVDVVRKKLGIRKVGHGGTLDPLATGLLIILVGKSTKLFPKLSNLDKKYEATLRLGVSTLTGDSQGRILKELPYENISSQDVEEIFRNFQGDIFQVPPYVSALRYKGKRLYELARRGKTVALAPRRIKIHSLKIRKINLPYVDFYVHCSKGTYVRKLAQDIGENLGCGACITKIRRTQIGQFSLKDAFTLEQINESSLVQPVQI